MKIVTIELKDKILEHIIETRNGAHFTIDENVAEATFEISEGLLFSFLKELEQLGYIRNLLGYGGGVTAFTVSAIDTFYEQGGFLKHYSLKNLLEDRLMYEVSEILKDPEKKEKKDILSKVKDLLPLVNTAITLIEKSVNAINN